MLFDPYCEIQVYQQISLDSLVAYSLACDEGGLSKE
jgi:hypothetical protein